MGISCSFIWSFYHECLVCAYYAWITNSWWSHRTWNSSKILKIFEVQKFKIFLLILCKWKKYLHRIIINSIFDSLFKLSTILEFWTSLLFWNFKSLIFWQIWNLKYLDIRISMFCFEILSIDRQIARLAKVFNVSRKFWLFQMFLELWLSNVYYFRNFNFLSSKKSLKYPAEWSYLKKLECFFVDLGSILQIHTNKSSKVLEHLGKIKFGIVANSKFQARCFQSQSNNHKSR